MSPAKKIVRKFEVKVDGTGNGGEQFFTATGVGAHVVTLLSSQMTTIAAGTGTVRLEREYEPVLQQKTTAGGTITSTYTALERATNLQ